MHNSCWEAVKAVNPAINPDCQSVPIVKTEEKVFCCLLWWLHFPSLKQFPLAVRFGAVRELAAAGELCISWDSNPSSEFGWHYGLLITVFF